MHIHTNASDGAYNPVEIVRKAKQARLKTIAITDHDTVAGVFEAYQEGEKIGVSVLSGVELSTKYHSFSIDVLGYGMRDLESFGSEIARFRYGRLDRAKAIIDKMNEIGMKLTLDDVYKHCEGEVIARPHIARAIVSKGYLPSVQSVFDLYLGDGKVCNVEKSYLSTIEAIRLISDFGGVAVLAHPALLKNNDLVKVILSECNFQGLEVWHSKHSQSDIKLYKNVAFQFGLILTGGSDFHNDEQKIGSFGHE